MPSCREVDLLLTLFVDGEATADQRSLVAAHLAACPPCRRRALAESAVRSALGSEGCRPCAPEYLRARCSKAASVGGIRGLTTRYSISSLSMAAALSVILGGAVGYGLTIVSPTVLAAQLALDHAKCFALQRRSEPIDARNAEEAFAQSHQWRLHLPQLAGRLQLLSVRNCFCGQGRAVHVMYRYDGRPLSLFVLHDVDRPRASIETLGHDAVIWSRQGSTYVLLGRESDAVLAELADDIDRGL